VRNRCAISRADGAGHQAATGERRQKKVDAGMVALVNVKTDYRAASTAHFSHQKRALDRRRE
jgi:hypothetical protein